MPQLRSVLFTLICVAVLTLATASPASARQVVVVLNNGTEVRGDMVGDNPEGVTLLISGIRREVARADIAEVREVVTPADEFRSKRTALKNDDYEGRIALATWGYDQGLYDLTLAELRSLEKAMPEDHADYRRVGLLIRVVTNRQTAEREAREAREAARDPRPTAVPAVPAPEVTEEPAADGATPSTGRPPRAEDKDLLTDEQINLLKVYEIVLSERPAVIVPPDTVDKLFDQYKSESALKPFMNLRGKGQFRGLQGYQQLDVMFQASARNLYDEVIVRTDPPAMLTWISNIHSNYILNYCGTAQCHGGETGNGYPLFLDVRSNRRVAYTNFYILNETKTLRGLMIDRNRPEESLLIQYGLPRELAKHPHPMVEGGAWRPYFREPVSNDRNYQLFTRWLGQELYRPAPNYGINYTVPPRSPMVTPAPADTATTPAPQP